MLNKSNRALKMLKNDGGWLQGGFVCASDAGAGNLFCFCCVLGLG